MRINLENCYGDHTSWLKDEVNLTVNYVTAMELAVAELTTNMTNSNILGFIPNGCNSFRGFSKYCSSTLRILFMARCKTTFLPLPSFGSCQIVGILQSTMVSLELIA